MHRFIGTDRDPVVDETAREVRTKAPDEIKGEIDRGELDMGQRVEECDAPAIRDGAAFAKAVAKRLEAEGVALDAGAYRDAPAGLRIWCGSTVETADVAALMPWIEWAYRTELAAQ